MLTPAACEREIRSLHQFFQAWYHGELPRDRFDRFADALAPSFSRITPEGTVQTRGTVLAGVREEYDRQATKITVQAVQMIDHSNQRALVRYEEQQTPGTDRLSTVLFGPRPDHGESENKGKSERPQPEEPSHKKTEKTTPPPKQERPVWLYLQETSL
ncbi:MAG: hypothetical protein J07HX5_00908 [halophilic archaeon J07HX5]|nr:MAG: hypothetical protein J07HX5_00908 [halophilic archaeon J07HX5]